MKPWATSARLQPGSVKIPLSPRNVCHHEAGLRQQTDLPYQGESKMKTPIQRSAFARANLCTYVQNRSISRPARIVAIFAVISLSGCTESPQSTRSVEGIRSNPLDIEQICVQGVKYHVWRSFKGIRALAPAYRPDGTLQGCREVGGNGE